MAHCRGRTGAYVGNEKMKGDNKKVRGTRMSVRNESDGQKSVSARNCDMRTA